MTDVAAPEIEGLAFVKKLGSGGFADVFLYDQAEPQRRVAVKILRDPSLSSRTIRSFQAEANAMARLEHPHIVPVFATGMTRDHRPYIVMMYYPRASLAERARSSRFSVSETLRLGIQLGSAIETAHRAGLLHRDIKPANVLTSAYGKPGLTDFGIAGQMSDEDDPETSVSVPWSPPETLYGTAPASVRSDVYSLAATLWHLLVGRSPFEVPGGDNSAFALMKRVRDVPAPMTGRGDVPASLDRLLRTALSKDPSVRPASVREFIGALQAVEQELRLPRTEVELAEDVVGQTINRPPPRGELTRVQTIQSVSPDRSSLALSDATDAGAGVTDLPTRYKPKSVTPVAGYEEGTHADTILRQAPKGSVLEAEGRPSVRVAPRSRGLAVALAALVLVAAIMVGWYLAGKGRSPLPAATVGVSEPPPDLSGGGLPPGVPVITAARSGDQVTFSWTYANTKTDDQVDWRVQGTTDVHTSTPGGTATVPLSSGGQTCIEVRIFRLDGSNRQGSTWTAKCG